MLREEVRIQLQIADAEASLRAARAFLYEALADAWHAAEQSRPVTLRESALLRLASVHATKAACEAVELAYHAAGSVSLFDASPLQRALRDVHAVRQHMMVADRYRQDVGRLLLGLEPQESPEVKCRELDLSLDSKRTARSALCLSSRARMKC